MSFKEGMAVVTIPYSAEEVANDNGNIRKGLEKNELYEAMWDDLTREFIVRVGNHLGTLAELGGKA